MYRFCNRISVWSDQNYRISLVFCMTTHWRFSMDCDALQQWTLVMIHICAGNAYRLVECLWARHPHYPFNLVSSELVGISGDIVPLCWGRKGVFCGTYSVPLQ